MDFDRKTMPATTKVSVCTKEEADYLEEKAKTYSDVQVLGGRQIASNMFEIELYLEDVTDLWLLGLSVGRKFPKNPY